MTQKLPQIYTASNATFPLQMRKITVQICGNFWVTQYVCCWMKDCTFPWFWFGGRPGQAEVTEVEEEQLHHVLAHPGHADTDLHTSPRIYIHAID